MNKFLNLISAEKLESLISTKYDFTIINCVQMDRSFHDNYLINTNVGDYVLRLYRANIRSLTEILFELDFINHLKSMGFNVSFPIPRNNGEFVSEINSPEGKRYATLFSFAPGNYPDPTKEVCYLYGRYIATFHKSLECFQTNFIRSYQFDIEHIVDQPMEYIRSVLSRLLQFIKEEKP